jgi:hypothetical protein
MPRDEWMLMTKSPLFRFSDFSDDFLLPSDLEELVLERETPVFSRWGLEEDEDEDALLELLIPVPDVAVKEIEDTPAYCDE